jgi:hypothetical protein
MKLDIEEVQKFSLLPGEILTVKFNNTQPHVFIKNFVEEFKKTFPNNYLLFIPESISFDKVISTAEKKEEPLYLDKLKKAREDIEEYLKGYFFEVDSWDLRQKIYEWINSYLEKNDLGKWEVNITSDHKSFNVGLTTNIQLDFHIISEEKKDG